ncbi:MULTISPECIES: hypothetical protein [Bradyrhizobium]|uniref:hypothetical protein n=1 Tax=Bradyrhizobium TaxID=374 RepID=UPI001E376D28|nr:hypothetical protein [Bradyrhizobium canariense]MBM7482473.1 hypothetical protein [Bradyrhizobium canariense]UFW69397.1 hypothetical protein BcanWU425_21840 [Bradyrhizobium canariense]
MLEHMARARSLPRATPALEPSHTAGTNILGDACGYAVLFGIIALLFQSRVPLYLGAFLFFTDGERIELALAKIGIRLELGTIGPDIIKGLPVRMVRAAGIAESVRPRLARDMDASRHIVVLARRNRSFVRHRRSIRNARDAACIAVVRI